MRGAERVAVTDRDPVPASSASDHRQRLLAAMIHTVAREGYAGASVARVIARAGVSRATFYEYFSGREECFLEAYRRATEHWRQSAAAVGGSEPAARLRAVLEWLLTATAADPATARLVLIEAFAAPPGVRLEHERAIAGVEGSIEDFLDESDAGAAALQIPGAALLGGVTGVIEARVLRGEGLSISRLRDDLLTWADAYELPAGEQRWEEGTWEWLGSHLTSVECRAEDGRDSGLLPRGRSVLPTGLAAAARRERIIVATAHVTTAKGYAEMTVADIVATARLSRGVFYSHFRGKEDVFLAAQTEGLRMSIGAAAAEFATGPTWPERVWGGLYGLLSYLAAHPERAFLGIAEIHAAGATAILRDHDFRMTYALFLEEGYRQRPATAKLPPICSEAIAGSLHELLRRRVVEGRTAQMLELLPQCAYLALAPFTGPEQAMEFVEAKARAAR